jgi:hypothetical protein
MFGLFAWDSCAKHGLAKTNKIAIVTSHFNETTLCVRRFPIDSLPWNRIEPDCISTKADFIAETANP